MLTKTLHSSVLQTMPSNDGQGIPHKNSKGKSKLSQSKKIQYFIIYFNDKIDNLIF